MRGAASGWWLVGDDGEPITPAQAWDSDWSAARGDVGVEVDEPAETRDRIRRFAPAAVGCAPADAFLAEILAAESDY